MYLYVFMYVEWLLSFCKANAHKLTEAADVVDLLTERK